MPQKPQPTPSPAMRQILAARQDVQRLHPLLSLLEAGEEESPIDQLVELLGAIAETQRRHSVELKRLSDRIDILLTQRAGGRRQ